MLATELVELTVDETSERYRCTLNAEDLLKAVSELNEPENNSERLKRIDNLRNAFIEQNQGFTPDCTEDKFVLKFLRARKFHHYRSLKLMISYQVQYHEVWPEVTVKVKNPLLVKHIYDAGCSLCLRGKAKDGSVVCIGRPGKAENSTASDYAAAFLITFEHLVEQESVQVNGLTLIYDFSFVGLGVDFLKQLPAPTKRFITLLQDVMPFRIKSINFVNESSAFDLMCTLSRLFLKKRMAKLVNLHGKNFNRLHSIIDPSILPPVYGGTGDSLDGAEANNWRDQVYSKFTAS